MILHPGLPDTPPAAERRGVAASRALIQVLTSRRLRQEWRYDGLVYSVNRGADSAPEQQAAQSQPEGIARAQPESAVSAI